MYPKRYVNLEDARRRFGHRVDLLGDLLMEGDALADEAAAALARLPRARTDELLNRLSAGDTSVDAPEALLELYEQLRHVPFWVDYERCDRGGSAFLRTGVFGGFVLALRSLVLGYCVSGGNKPLMFSGQLQRSAPRRLSETSRFVEAVSLPGGLRIGAPGFAVTARVRLMHAQVRRVLSSSPRWSFREWGVPINQTDMAYTVLLFSLAVVDGLRRFGVPFTQEEAGDLIHLWRYAGYRLGVREELLCADEREARVLWEIIGSTHEPPDEDSAALAHALIRSPVTQAPTPERAARAERVAEFAYGISRYLIGDEFADALEYPRNAWRVVAPVLRPVLSGATHLLRLFPGVDALALQAGMTYWRDAVALGLGREDAAFDIPRAIPGA